MGSNPVGRTIFFQHLPYPGRFFFLSVIKPISPTYYQEESVE